MTKLQGTPLTTRLLDPLFTTDRMREILSDARCLQSMLDFEAALARALETASVAPRGSAAVIASQCDATLFDLGAIARDAVLSGNVAIPLIKALTARVAKVDDRAASFVHWGATSQDAMDTGLILQLRDVFAIFDSGLADLEGILTRLADRHVATLVVGRTWLQQGPPVTLGLKAAGWLSAIRRHRARLAETRERVLVIQFGGAVGTLAALEERGLSVAVALAQELKLKVPDLPWHAHRDRMAEVATVLGLMVGTLGKIARDISLLSQSEIDEVAEPAAPGKGGSSTMPHKRNPVGSAVVLAAATRVPGLVSTMLAAMVQEHERGLGGWHAEWETLPEICLLAAGALARSTEILDGIEVHEEHMARNLGVTHGLILAEAVAFALGKRIGKESAHRLVERTCRQSVDAHRLRDVLLDDKEVRVHLSAEEIDRLLDPANYLGSARQLTKNVLAASGKDKPGDRGDS